MTDPLGLYTASSCEGEGEGGREGRKGGGGGGRRA